MQFEENYRKRLLSLKDEAYYHFIANLVPGSKQIGIRIPILRKLAKEFIKEDYQKYLSIKSIYREEKIIKGLIIGSLNTDFKNVLSHLEDFLPEIDSWEICDTTVSGLKIFKIHLEEGLIFIDSCLKSNETFSIRFGLVLLLSYYLKEEYLDYIFKILKNLKSEEYYVRMAAAWLVSYLYIMFPKVTLKLFDGSLDKFTHNKAISKINESFQVKKADKDFFRTLRRR
jgi:3-methyladenine DNA glycosylase AlkD